jgi:hypothetical protein
MKRISSHHVRGLSRTTGHNEGDSLAVTILQVVGNDASLTGLEVGIFAGGCRNGGDADENVQDAGLHRVSGSDVKLRLPDRE